MPCLSDNTVAALVTGSVAEAERNAIDDHLDGCAACRELLAALAGDRTESNRDRSVTVDDLSEITAIANAPTAAFEGEGRYQALGLLGVGGMGEVYAVRDTLLDRLVALKRPRTTARTDFERERFLHEAKLTAGLEHPNIVPIHDLGISANGDPFFIMKRVEGMTLKHLLSRLSASDAALEEQYPLTRLVIVFLQITQAVAYAHSRGVLHCDLKPQNVLLGKHGEVLVTDWGLARPLLTGTTKGTGGTPRFMSPEQARGGVLDVRSDIYSLGAILYELLTLGPVPHAPGGGPGTERQEHLIEPPSVRAPAREMSPEIEQVCLRALARDPDERFATARELTQAVEAFLTGARRRSEAKLRLGRGDAHRAHYEERLSYADELEVKRTTLSSEIKPFENEVRKKPLWDLEAQVERARAEADLALAEALDCFSQALGLDPGFREAADRLADVHLRLFLEAEANGDRRATLEHRRQVERHHHGRYESLLRGEGTVRVHPRDPNARLRCLRVAEQGKRLVAGEQVRLEPPPGPWTLASGSYLFEVSAEGKRTAKLHVLVGRGTQLELSAKLFSDAEIGDGFVHVPAGPFIYGGDRVALNSAPREERTLPDFFIGRFAVTCDEYLQFLNALAAETPQQAEQHVPRNRPDGGHLWPRDSDGTYRLPAFDADGNPCHPRTPVMGVSFHDAQTYADWRSRRDGQPYRLPTEYEWEKAARGADGRFFPWGNGFDPTFCKMALSRPGRPQPEPVGSFPVDSSVYGMQDAAGAIREWCDSFFDEAHETRVLRGGAWYFNPHYCRLAFRHGYLPHVVFTNFGFRLCRSAAD